MPLWLDRRLVRQTGPLFPVMPDEVSLVILDPIYCILTFLRLTLAGMFGVAVVVATPPAGRMLLPSSVPPMNCFIFFGLSGVVGTFGDVRWAAVFVFGLRPEIVIVSLLLTDEVLGVPFVARPGWAV